ncbi:MAG: ribosome recycling factor [Clostridia bacterium]|nr:ribosome recycling factor [Clostridia bacterium]
MMVLECEEKMGKSLDVLKADVIQIRAGRANPRILDKVLVEAYGGMSPINQLGNIAVSDGQCLVISPWDKSLLKSIEKAIQLSNIGLTPTNDGNVIRLVFPVLTDERRRELCKQVRKMGEDGKVAIRNIRREFLDSFKKLKTSKEITEDQYAQYETKIDKLTSKNVDAIDKVIGDKEKEIMTV